jgi:hypothetical protein
MTFSKMYNFGMTICIFSIRMDRKIGFLLNTLNVSFRTKYPYPNEIPAVSSYHRNRPHKISGQGFPPRNAGVMIFSSLLTSSLLS